MYIPFSPPKTGIMTILANRSPARDPGVLKKELQPGSAGKPIIRNSRYMVKLSFCLFRAGSILSKNRLLKAPKIPFSQMIEAKNHLETGFLL